MLLPFQFIAYFLKGEKVLAVASMQADPVASKASELMRLGKMPSASEIKGGVVRANSTAYPSLNLMRLPATGPAHHRYLLLRK